jgi:NADH:ubiquinone oxidoreductase subunit H
MRYDHLINLTWKRFLPISLTCLLLVFPITILIWYGAGWTDNSDDVN